MEFNATTVLITVLRESVSLFVLLVFLVFAFNVVNRILKLFENFGERLVEALESIANSMK